VLFVEPHWLDKNVILSIHNKLAAEFGGKLGLKDPALLEAALKRPVNKFHYENASITMLAASYAFGLIKNHPFIDGNKRIGLVAMELFLIINDIQIQATQVEKYTMVMNVASGVLSEEEVAMWIKDHI
jgi:death-on-curing protein